MAIERIISIILRAAELACAAIVAGINGDYLDDSNASSWELGRFIYTEVVAGIAILFSVLWLLPFSGGFINWPMDVIISILWWVVFGLLVDVSHSRSDSASSSHLNSSSAMTVAMFLTGATWYPTATSVVVSRP